MLINNEPLDIDTIEKQQTKIKPFTDAIIKLGYEYHAFDNKVFIYIKETENNKQILLLFKYVNTLQYSLLYCVNSLEYYSEDNININNLEERLFYFLEFINKRDIESD